MSIGDGARDRLDRMVAGIVLVIGSGSPIDGRHGAWDGTNGLEIGIVLIIAGGTTFDGRHGTWNRFDLVVVCIMLIIAGHFDADLGHGTGLGLDGSSRFRRNDTTILLHHDAIRFGIVHGLEAIEGAVAALGGDHAVVGETHDTLLQGKQSERGADESDHCRSSRGIFLEKQLANREFMMQTDAKHASNNSNGSLRENKSSAEQICQERAIGKDTRALEIQSFWMLETNSLNQS